MNKEVYSKYIKEKTDQNGNLVKIEINPTKNFNFSYDILDQLAKKFPNDLALVWCDNENNSKKLTFKQISHLSNKAANYLKHCGIKKGDFVLIILKRQLEFWIILNALHKIGAVAIPATHMLTIDDLKYRINFAKINSVIFTTQNNVSEKILEIQKICSDLKRLICIGEKTKNCFNFLFEYENFSEIFERNETYVTDPMIGYFTSGTTGMPKLVIHNFAYPLAHIVTAKYWQKAQAGKLHLTVSDTGWAKAIWGKMYGQWMVRAVVMVYDFDKFAAEDLLNIINKYKVKTFCAPPTVYRFFIKNDSFQKNNLPYLEYATTAGEALEIEIIKEFKQKTGLEIVTAFGQTETTPVLINQNINETKRGSLGKPSPIYEVTLLNKFGDEVTCGEIGEICIKLKSNKNQIGLFNCYWNDENLNKFANRNGFYHTGDSAYFDKDGYYFYVGRIDDIIKSSGYRIGPFEIESVLVAHPAVLECAVVGVFDETRGQIIKAIVVLTENYAPSEELVLELQNFVKQRTAPYKYPRIIEFKPNLPKTISGKVKRKILKISSV